MPENEAVDINFGPSKKTKISLKFKIFKANNYTNFHLFDAQIFVYLRAGFWQIRLGHAGCGCAVADNIGVADNSDNILTFRAVLVISKNIHIFDRFMKEKVAGRVRDEARKFVPTNVICHSENFGLFFFLLRVGQVGVGPMLKK